MREVTFPCWCGNSFGQRNHFLKFSNSQGKISKLVDFFLSQCIYVLCMHMYLTMLYELSNVYPIHDCVATCHFRSHYAILKVEHKCANVQCKCNAYLLEENTFFPFPGILVYVQHEKINGKISIN